MRETVKKVVSEDIITLRQLADLLGIKEIIAYRYVVTDGVCEHLRIGRNHIVIDREDIDLVRERIARSNSFKESRKAN